MSKFTLHQSLVITNGTFKGLAGEVIQCDDQGETVTLHIQGVFKDKTIDKVLNFGFHQVRAL